MVSHCKILLFGAMFLAACATQEQKAAPKLSQLQIRQVQTRSFPSETKIAGMKAVSAALQDEAYAIEDANVELGLIIASLTVDDVDTSSRDLQKFWRGFAKDYRSARTWKVTVNVAEINRELRIRISLVAQVFNESGGIIFSQQVTDPKPYQALFSKIDKSVFLQKNKL